MDRLYAEWKDWTNTLKCACIHLNEEMVEHLILWVEEVINNSLVHNGTYLYPNSRRHLLASCHLRTIEQWKVSSSWICTSVGPRPCRVLTVYAQTAAIRKRLTRRRASGVSDKCPRGTRMLSCWQDKRPRIRSIDRSDQARIHEVAAFLRQRHRPARHQQLPQGIRSRDRLWLRLHLDIIRIRC